MGAGNGGRLTATCGCVKNTDGGEKENKVHRLMSRVVLGDNAFDGELKECDHRTDNTLNNQPQSVAPCSKQYNLFYTREKRINNSGIRYKDCCWTVNVQFNNVKYSSKVLCDSRGEQDDVAYGIAVKEKQAIELFIRSLIDN